MMKIIFALLLSVSGASVADDKVADQIRMVSEKDRNMNMAIDEARRTLPDFLALSKNPPDGAKDFKLKVMMSDENGVEHLWVTPFKEIQGGFAGILANKPEVIKSVVWGKVYAFKIEQISDWGYELKGKQMGSFTVCALFKSMPNDEVAQYKKDYGFICDK